MKHTARLGVSVLFACAAVISLVAQTPSAGAIPKLDVEKYTLANGLDVILSEDHRLPLVGVDLWYHVGPAFEPPGRTGFAHLFEHMMFQGSKHVPGDSHFKNLSGAGATGINGTTDFDRTNYFESVPANQLELALWLESDRMGYLLDELDQEKLSNQQDVVRNERRQSYENRPYGIVEEAFFKAMFPAGHPYHGVVIGSHADIQAAKLEDVRDFFKQYYAPNNASLAIAGDFDKATVKKLVEKYFGTLKRGPAVPAVSAKTEPITSERRATVQDRVELPRVYMGWITPPIFKEGDADGNITSGVLGGGKSSRLYKKLVYEKQIAQNVNAYQYSLMLGSVFGIEATARPGHTAQELEAAINEELDRIRKEAPAAAEVDRARNVLETQIVKGLQNLGGFGGVADLLNQYNHFLGNPNYLTQDITRHRNVTPASVHQFAQKYLQNANRVVVYGVPGQQQLPPEVPTPPAPAKTSAANDPVNADEPWRATQPKPAAARAARLPVPQTFQLPNGLTVIASPQTGTSIVSATLVVRTGTDANPIDKPGLAGFTTAMLDQGTTNRTALQLADEVAQLGASLNTNSSIDTSVVSVSSLARNFPAALNLLADVVLHPTFPAEEVERVRGLRVADLTQDRGNPNAIADRVMAAVLYGSSHPYGAPASGTEAAVKSTTRDELQAFWRRNFVPANAALVVAGAMTVPELRKIAESALGTWPKGAAPAINLPATTSARPRLVIVDRPNSPQTQLRVATIGMARANPDYIPARVMNTLLGGIFSSRINLNLREAHGYTYGAQSQFNFNRNPGPFEVRSGVRTDVTAPAVHEVMGELVRITDSRVTPDELTLVKDYITQSLPANFETTDRTVTSLGTIFTYRLPITYFTNLAEQISVVDAQAVQEVARKYIIPKDFVVIAVGDRSKIAEPLEKELGVTAEFRDADGRVVK